MIKKITLSLLCFFLCLNVFAQSTPQAVWNGYPTFIRYIAEFNDRLFFNAGNELWCTDGSGYDSYQVKAIGPGTAGPYGFTKFNGKLYFIATDSTHGAELWVTDGSTPGTQMVKDINPFVNKSAFNVNQGNYNSHLIQIMNGKMYFIADDSLHGNEIWESDGTAAGTQMVKDIFPVADSSSISGQYYTNENFLLVGNKIYFPANDGTGNGIELWSTDGTSTGTQMVKDIAPGSFGSNPSAFIAYQDKLIFTIDSAYSRKSIYISDGSASGTFGLAFGYQNTTDNVFMNNKLYFCTTEYGSGNRAYLSETDGTWLNTNIVDTIGTIFGVALPDGGRGTIGLTKFNNKLYFRSYFITGSGSELWQSDGTNAGTGLLKEMYPGNFSSNPYGLVALGNKLYFKTDDSLYVNLSYTDGTPAGTQKVVMPGHDYKMANIFQKRQYMASPIVPIGNKLYFANPYDSTVGVRIYRMDMFPAGISSQPEISSIDIYPNPSQGFITVDAEGAKNISIHSIDGKLVYQSENISAIKHTVDTHNFASGTYSITTILSDGNKRHGKFVKQ